MKIKVKENLPVIVERHPYYESINKKLMEQVNSLSFRKTDHYDVTNIRGSTYTLGNTENPTIKLIKDWIKELIAINIYRHPTFPLSNFEFWFARLNEEKGQLTWDHDHLLNSTLSAVYFVNTPKGSSPLVLTTTGRKIKAEEGKLVIFPASLRHGVPQNNCKNRITLACNIQFGSLQV